MKILWQFVMLTNSSVFKKIYIKKKKRVDWTILSGEKKRPAKECKLWTNQTLVAIYYSHSALALGLSKPNRRPNPPEETNRIRSIAGRPDYSGGRQQVFTTKNQLQQVDFGFPPPKLEKPNDGIQILWYFIFNYEII